MVTPTEPIIRTPRDPQVTKEEEVGLLQYARRFDGIALAIGGIALVALTNELESFLTPFVLIVAFYIMLTPFRDYKAAKAMMWTGGFLFGFWFLVTLSGLLIPFILAALIAYLFNPLVTKLKEKRNIARGWSAIGVVVMIFGILTFLGWFFLPALYTETEAFFSRFSKWMTQYSNSFDDAHIRRFLMSLGVPSKAASSMVTTHIAPQIKKILEEVPVLLIAFITKIPHYLERTLNLIIVPFATFYLLRDWPKIGNVFFSFFPAKNRARKIEIATHIDRLLYAYIRGQIMVATIIGILGTIAFWILGVPYYGILGVIIGLTDLIPIIGLVFSIIVVEIVIFLTMELSVGVVLSGVGIIALLHILEAYVIGPRIVGKGVGIPPIIMILSLLVFGYFLGFIGLLIAVPATAVIILFLEEYRTTQNTTPEELNVHT